MEKRLSLESGIIKIFNTEDTGDHRGEPTHCDRCSAWPLRPTPRPLHINQITAAVVSSAMRVHSSLGPGLLESVYEGCLRHELRKRGFKVAGQVGLPVLYEGEKIDLGYRIDLLVEDVVIVEVKSIDLIHPVHQAQLLTYLRLSGIGVGLLINFNVVHLRDGIKRMVVGRDWQK